MKFKQVVAVTCNLFVVRRNHKSYPKLLIQMEHELQHHLRGCRIQIAGWLICEDQAGLSGDGAGQRHTLLLTTRKFRRFVPLPVCQIHLRHQVTRPVKRFASTPAFRQQRQGNILQSADRREQVVKLKDKTDVFPAEAGEFTLTGVFERYPIDRQFPAGGAVNTAQEVQQRGFTPAAGPDDHTKSAPRNVKNNAAQGLNLLVATPVYSGKFSGFDQYGPICVGDI